jgi:imidazole glycerol-phosphate synthase subunit HisH
MAEVTVIDYGLGNIQAFMHVYDRLNIEAEVASTPDEIARAKRLILPGVGSFDWAVTRLNQSGLRETLDDVVLGGKRPVLGVCVGMQMMAERSDEGSEPGLGWIDAEVRDMARLNNRSAPLPHMGWNDVEAIETDTLFYGIEVPRYYFLHSFYMQPRSEADNLATAVYGNRFTAAIRRGNIFGTQFHPEKSHQWGISLLRNFATL